MRTVLNQNQKIGVFMQELKNRFLCEVKVDESNAVCYVPLSCHLGHFLNLPGKRVILVPTQSNETRTKYALFAVPYKRSYILLNASLANRAIKESIMTQMFSYLGTRKHVFYERYIEDYRCDLFIEDTNTILEIKSVLSVEERAGFPTVFSERSIKQLRRLGDLLDIGYHVHYIIVSLNPYVKSITIIKATHFSELFLNCIKRGMTASAYTCSLKDNRIIIKHRIPIEMGEN